MDTIIDFQDGTVNSDTFQEFMWGSGQRLIEEIGEEVFVFYLFVKESDYDEVGGKGVRGD